MTKDEALRLALEALEHTESRFHTIAWGREQDAITAIKAALEAKDEPIKKQIIKIKTIDEPCNQVMALGQMMRDWLQSQIADSNTSVDVGKGLSEFDLWVQCEGKELFITIKEKND
jgi:predicted RNA-binding protein Jag